MPFRIPLFFLLLSLGGMVHAAREGESAAPTAETLAGRKKALTASSLDAAVKQAALTLLTEAETLTEQADRQRREAAAFRDRTANLPARAAELGKADRAKPAAAPPEDAPLETLEIAAAAARDAMEKARQALTDARESPRVNAARRKELAVAAADQAARLTKLRAEAPAPAAGEAPELTEARTVQRAAAIAAAESAQDSIQAEQALHEAEEAVGWSTLSQEAANVRVEATAAAAAALQKRLDTARRRSADSSLEAAEENAAGASADLRPVLDEVARRAAQNQNVVGDLIPAAENRLRATEAEVRRWADQALLIRAKIQRLGASGVVGVELRRQRQNLPSDAVLRVRHDERQDEITTVESARLSLEEELAGLATVSESSSPRGKALQSRRDGLTELLKNYGRYFNILLRQDDADRQLSSVVGSHRKFIHEQILWLPSALPAGRDSLPALYDSAKWLGAGLTSPGLLTDWWNGVRSAPLVSGLLLAGALALFGLRNMARHRLKICAADAAKPEAGFKPTGRAIFWTLCMTLPIPGLMWCLAQPWQNGDLASAFSLAVAAGLEVAAVVLLGMEMVRQPLRPSGLAEAHFRWPVEDLRNARRQLHTLSFIVIPAAWLNALLRHSDEVRHDAAERGCLMIILLAGAWWLHRLWQRGRAALDAHAPGPGRGLARLGWRLSHFASVLVPLGLIILAARGYLHTAEVLTGTLALTLLTGVFFLLGRAVFFRWYQLHRRLLRSARAKQLREAREASRGVAAETTPGELAPEVLPDSMSGPDIDGIAEEMRQLVDVISFVAAACIAWLIWADVLPAAQKLTDTPIERLTSIATGQTLADAPPGVVATPLYPLPAALVTPEKSEPTAKSFRTTPGDIFLALAAVVLTILAAKRVPGALQFVLSSQIALDPGLRFALGTVTRYLIFITGSVIALRTLGLAWSNVQWLAAALTVGLGFGLQEIFANFFSGLIILFERPIRPGDVVTIDNITGTVTRIQIRATTLRTGDYTEYIVPNREFITGKLLNWTHSDTVNRIIIEVGVAPETDIPAALALLKSIAESHPSVLREPAPSAACESFQESSIRLVLRVYLATLDQRFPTRTDLNIAVAREFHAAGIHIPYPRREAALAAQKPPEPSPGTRDELPG